MLSATSYMPAIAPGVKVVVPAAESGGTAVAISRPSPATGSLHAGAALVDDLYDAIRRRSASLQGRRRVADAILALALDIVGGGESLPRQDRIALLTALADPVNEATEEALRTLMVQLTDALRTASVPAHTVLARGQLVRRMDFE